MNLRRPLLAFVCCIGIVSAHAQSADTSFIFAPFASGHALPGTQRDNHASTLVELRNGDILAAWFA